MQRQFSGIFLLFCLAVPLLVTGGWLRYQKALVRKAVKRQIFAGIDRQELVLLKFTKTAARTALRWEHTGEFEFEGRMYDVVETGARGDSLFFRCWPDDAETRLNNQLKALVPGALENNPAHRESREQLAKFYKSLYFLYPQGLQPIDEGLLRRQRFSVIPFFPPARRSAPPNPPPETG